MSRLKYLFPFFLAFAFYSYAQQPTPQQKKIIKQIEEQEKAIEEAEKEVSGTSQIEELIKEKLKPSITSQIPQNLFVENKFKLEFYKEYDPILMVSATKMPIRYNEAIPSSYNFTGYQLMYSLRTNKLERAIFFVRGHIHRAWSYEFLDDLPIPSKITEFSSEIVSLTQSSPKEYDYACVNNYPIRWYIDYKPLNTESTLTGSSISLLGNNCYIESSSMICINPTAGYFQSPIIDATSLENQLEDKTYYTLYSHTYSARYPEGFTLLLGTKLYIYVQFDFEDKLYVKVPIKIVEGDKLLDALHNTTSLPGCKFKVGAGRWCFLCCKYNIIGGACLKPVKIIKLNYEHYYKLNLFTTNVKNVAEMPLYNLTPDGLYIADFNSERKIYFLYNLFYNKIYEAGIIWHDSDGSILRVVRYVDGNYEDLRYNPPLSKPFNNPTTPCEKVQNKVVGTYNWVICKYNRKYITTDIYIISPVKGLIQHFRVVNNKLHQAM